ncbi:Hypothetical predicted protein [Scomber scombrus]|uniref:Uncharacterized protein n=1 Tax=Scomber scombrus TaxID=13677 RepID=A0AAV1NNG7_SCOSC
MSVQDIQMKCTHQNQRVVGPLTDRQNGEVVSFQKLWDQLGHETDDIIAFSGLLNSNKAEIRASVLVLQDINIVHQGDHLQPAQALTLERSWPLHHLLGAKS